MIKIFMQIKKYLKNIFENRETKNKDDFLNLIYKAAEYSNKEQMKIHRKAMEMSTA